MYKAYNREGKLLACGNGKRECINNGKLKKYNDSLVILNENSSYIISKKGDHRAQVKITHTDNESLISIYYNGNSFLFSSNEIGTSIKYLRASIEIGLDIGDIFDRLVDFANAVPVYIDNLPSLWK